MADQDLWCLINAHDAELTTGHAKKCATSPLCFHLEVVRKSSLKTKQERRKCWDLPHIFIFFVYLNIYDVNRKIYLSRRAPKQA